MISNGTYRMGGMLAGIAALALAPAAYAQTPEEGGDATRLRGTIEAFREVRLAGEQDDHTLLRLRTSEGDRRFVDLGPGVERSDLHLDRGDRIVVSGTEGRIGDRGVVNAERLYVLEHAEQEEGTEGTEGRTARFSGRIDGFKRVQVAGEAADEHHAFVRLQLEDGDSRIVALGPSQTLRELDLQQGDRITVIGREARFGDRDVVVARVVAVDGEVWRLGPQGRQRQPAHRDEQARVDGTGVQRGDREDARIARASGTVEGFRRLETRAGEQQVFVLIEEDDGARRVLRFDSVAPLRRLDLRLGDQIEVQGTHARIGRLQVLEPRSVVLDGQRYRIRGGDAESQRHPAQRRQGMHGMHGMHDMQGMHEMHSRMHGRREGMEHGRDGGGY